jgi:hypothetical protein
MQIDTSGRAGWTEDGIEENDGEHPMSIKEGGCACGGVRYRLTAPPLFTHCCHCRDCQRQTGSAFAINALIETDRIEVLSGEPKQHAMPTDSGRPHDIHRCPECGTAVWSDYGRRAYLRFVRVGTLDRPEEVTPDVHIFTRSKLPWLRLPEGARAFDAFYELKQEWPAQSLARRQAAAEESRRV